MDFTCTNSTTLPNHLCELSGNTHPQAEAGCDKSSLPKRLLGGILHRLACYIITLPAKHTVQHESGIGCQPNTPLLGLSNPPPPLLYKMDRHLRADHYILEYNLDHARSILWLHKTRLPSLRSNIPVHMPSVHYHISRHVRGRGISAAVANHVQTIQLIC